MAEKNGCTLCPRMCGAHRSDRVTGFCGAGASVRIARAAPHFWEEPCISGTNGSGTVFFSGCSLRCCFCQNYSVSHERFGRDISEERLCEIMLTLQERGVHNINLVSATPYTEQILRVLDRIRGTKLKIPIVWNTGGYERVETVRLLSGYVDIYLPDLKYYDAELSQKYSGARDYFTVAMSAIREMVRQTGSYQLGENGILMRGTVIRHLVLPSHRRDSFAVVDAIADSFSRDSVLVSFMSQYTPFYRASEFPEINRRITTFEYESVCNRVKAYGFDGFFQEKSSAKEEYTPPFDLEGV